MVTRRVEEAATARRFRVRGRSDLGRRVLRRRQHRHERRRQEGRAVGHGARQPRLVAHGRPGRSTGSRSTRVGHNLGKIHDVAIATFELVWKDGRSPPDSARVLRTERLVDRGPPLPQGGARQGRHRQVPRWPARRAEGRLRRHHHVGALDRAPHAGAHPHGLPRVLRPGARRRSRPSSRSATTWRATAARQRRAARRPRTPRRALPARRRLRHQVEARRAAQDGAARRHRRRRRDGRGTLRVRRGPHRQRPRRRGLRRGRRRGAQVVLARPGQAPRRSPGTPTPSSSTRTS